MHELRKDPLLGRWVAVLSKSLPPSEYQVLENITESDCLLCPGKEGETPAEITSIKEDGRWLVRVIPHFNPIFQIEGDLGRRGVGMYDRMNNIGANEIVIETPEHERSPEDIGIDQINRVLNVYRDRLADLEKDARLRYVFIYKNRGRAAGAIFSHPHSQVVATPIIPKRIKEELDGAKQYYAYKERCIFCDMMREEMRMEDRVIYETRDFIAFSPFAPKFPFEFWILPKRHSCAYQDIISSEIEDLSLMMITMIQKLKKVLNNPPYNLVIHTAPNRIPRKDHWHTLGEDFHWHIEVMPRLIRMSGFEWGSGFYILSTSPEEGAKYLREA